ncbi:MAG: hypothetical protein RRY25_07090, partial [Anaerovorax sp.]
KSCNFVIWKEDKFFVSKRKPLTKPMVKAFLEKGRIKAAGLYSEKRIPPIWHISLWWIRDNT